MASPLDRRRELTGFRSEVDCQICQHALCQSSIARGVLFAREPAIQIQCTGFCSEVDGQICSISYDVVFRCKPTGQNRLTGFPRDLVPRLIDLHHHSPLFRDLAGRVAYVASGGPLVEAVHGESREHAFFVL